MTLPKLILTPDANGYQSVDGESAIYIALEGGAGRSRLDKLGAAKSVTASWTMNRVQYQYWRAFYRTATKEGSLPFLCDMLSEDGNGPAEHECRFIPGSVQLASVQGFTYIQQARLEVIPMPIDEDFDNAVIAIFESSEGALDDWFAALEHLTLITMPETLGG